MGRGALTRAARVRRSGPACWKNGANEGSCHTLAPHVDETVIDLAPNTDVFAANTDLHGPGGQADVDRSGQEHYNTPVGGSQLAPSRGGEILTTIALEAQRQEERMRSSGRG